MANKLYEETDVQAIADAIRAKGVSGTMTVAQMAGKIGEISSGNGGTGLDGICFYDYDGTLLYSYALSDLPLTSLPASPDHSTNEVPLTFQGWDYTLEQVNACTNKLNVGATYIPTDGKTHLIINIAVEGRMNLPLYISQTISNGVSIDWGDGSAVQTLTNTGNIRITHAYGNTGKYDIALAVSEGCVLGFGNSSSSYCILGSNSMTNEVYDNMLKKVYVGSGVTDIGDYAFQHCRSLESITMPTGVINIGAYAFLYCNSLVSILIPNSVTTIGTYAFSYCYSLALIILSNSVTSIGNYVAAFCYALTSIVIPNSITVISDRAFYGCYAFVSITIPDSVTTIGNYAFYKCCSLASINIPSGVTSIGDYAFGYCCCLASIAIPDSVTNIGSYVFGLCDSLASATIPEGVTTLGSYAFSYCSALASIVIPDSVASIDENVFIDCSGMAVYDFSSCTSIPTLANTNAFTSIPPDCVMRIPSALFSTWSTATNWSTYASKMVAV